MLLFASKAGNALAKGEALPRVLEAYAAQVLLNEATLGKRGKGRPPEWLRNLLIVYALDLLDLVGVPPTRNCATDPDLDCGSRIVAELFSDAGVKIGEAGVAIVREEYREIILPAGSAPASELK
jgi:hypothetical protein